MGIMVHSLLWVMQGLYHQPELPMLFFTVPVSGLGCRVLFENYYDIQQSPIRKCQGLHERCRMLPP